MAQNDNAVLIAGTGAIWTGTVGSATKPTLAQLQAYASAGTVPAGHTSIGHTSIEDLPTPGQEEGETATKGSWQNAALATIIESQPIDTIDISALQVLDNEVLTYYHGGGNAATANEFAWPDSPSPVERAVTAVYVHSATRVLGLWIPRASLYRGDAIEFSSTEFTVLPIRITLLKASGQPKAIWIADELGAA